jgi:parallel beta-helix repeat protein
MSVPSTDEGGSTTPESFDLTPSSSQFAPALTHSGGKVRGTTIVRARAVRNLPAPPERNVRAVLDVSLGRACRSIETIVRAGTTTCTLKGKTVVALLTRSTLLSCRIALRIEPNAQVEQLTQPLPRRKSILPYFGAASEDPWELGVFAIPVQDLLQRRYKGWFPLEGIKTQYKTELFLDVCYIPEGTEFEHSVSSDSAGFDWEEEDEQTFEMTVGEDNRCATPKSSQFTDSNDGDVSCDTSSVRDDEAEHVLEKTIRDEIRCTTPKSSHFTQATDVGYHKSHVTPFASSYEGEGAKGQQENSLHLPGDKTVAAKTVWRNGHGKVFGHKVTEKRNRVGAAFSPPLGAKGAATIRDAAQLCVEYGHESALLLVEVNHGGVFVCESMLQNLKEQLQCDVARCLRVPYHRVKMDEMSRNEAAIPSISGPDMKVSQRMIDGGVEWLMSFRLLNDCKNPLRNATTLLHDLICQCHSKHSYIHQGTGTKNLLALLNEEREALWVKGDENVGNEKCEENEETCMSESYDNEADMQQLGMDCFQVFDIVSEIHHLNSRTRTVSVDASYGGHFTSISSAIAACESGDTVVVGSGEYHEDLCIGVDNISLIAASEISGYGHLNAISQHSANCCKPLPPEDVLLSTSTSPSTLDLVQDLQQDQSPQQGLRTVIVYGNANVDSPVLFSTARGIRVAGFCFCHTGKSRCKSAAVLVAGGDIHFRDVIVSRSGGNGVSVECGVLTLLRCGLVSCNGAALEAKEGSRIRIEKSLFANCQKDGLVVPAGDVICRMSCVHGNRGIGIKCTVNSERSQSSFFEANVIRENEGGGILVGISSCKFVRNVLKANGVAEMIACGTSSPAFVGNRLEAALGNGIVLDDNSEARVFGNEVCLCCSTGVVVRGHANPSLDRNVIRECARSGVCVSGDAKGTYRENKIISNKNCGMRILGRVNMLLQNNTIESNFSAGILVQGDAIVTLHQNRVIENTGANLSIKDNSMVTAHESLFESSSSQGLVVASSTSSTFTSCCIQLNKAGNVLVEKDGQLQFETCHIGGSILLGGPSVWIREDANLRLTDCRLSLSTDALVKVSDRGVVEINRNLLEKSQGDGILVQDEAHVIVLHSTVTECHTALHLQGQANVTGFQSEFLNNSTFGALCNGYSCLEFERSTFCDNKTANLSSTGFVCVNLRQVLLHDSVTGILLDSRCHGVFFECHIHSCENGVVVMTDEDADATVFDRCIVSNCEQYGVCCEQASSLSCTHCELFDCGDSCIHLSGKSKAHILECRIFSSESYGVWVGERASGSMKGNTIFENKTAGISLHDKACPDILGNTIHDNNSGVIVCAWSSPQISANRFEDNQLVAIQIQDSADPIVESNHVLRGHGIGVLMLDQSKGVLRLNQLVDGHAIAFELHDRCDPLIEGNTINGQRQGVVCRHFSRGIVHSNDIFEISDTGILLLDSCSSLLTSNRMSQCDVAVSASDDSTAIMRENSLLQNKAALAVCGRAHLLVEKNEFSRNHSAGIQVMGSAQGEFKQNLLRENQGPSVIVSGSSDPLFFNNVISNGLTYGLVVSGFAKGMAIKNRFECNQQAQIRIEGHSAPTLQNNFIHKGMSYGLVISDRSRPVVDTNDFCGNKSSALVLTGQSNATVFANSCQENGKHGAEILQQARGKVRGNSFVRCMSESVVVSGEAAPSIESNLILYGLHDGLLIRCPRS